MLRTTTGQTKESEKEMKYHINTQLEKFWAYLLLMAGICLMCSCTTRQVEVQLEDGTTALITEVVVEESVAGAIGKEVTEGFEDVSGSVIDALNGNLPTIIKGVETSNPIAVITGVGGMLAALAGGYAVRKRRRAKKNVKKSD